MRDPVRHSWEFNRQFFGWTVNQWQAWARGDINVSPEQAQQTWAVRCANVGEFWIGDQRFHGDWYGYGERWSRVVLPAGVHRVRVRLAAEVRLFGGSTPPPLTFVMEFQPVVGDVVPLQGGRIVPEMVDGRLVTNPLALALFNGAATRATALAAAVNDTRVRDLIALRTRSVRCDTCPCRSWPRLTQTHPCRSNVRTRARSLPSRLQTHDRCSRRARAGRWPWP